MSDDAKLGFTLLGCAVSLIWFCSRDDGYWLDTIDVCQETKTMYVCRKDTFGERNAPVAICNTKEECNSICGKYIKEHR